MVNPQSQLKLDFDAVPDRDRARPAGKPSRDAEIARMLAELNIEFDRLNKLHFAGKHKRPTIEFSTRKSFGGYYQKLRHRIVLSWQAYIEHGWDEVLNTFRHEVAHIVHLNHSHEFWRLAGELGVTKKYAANPLTPRKTSMRLYVYACPACGGQVHRRKRLRNASCGRCDRSYNPRYKLKLVKEENSQG